MMNYTVRVDKSAEKELSKLPKTEIQKIRVAVLALAENPRPFGSTKLKGREAHRIRVGDYRVIYEIKDDILLVLVVAVGHRKGIYDKK